MMKKLGLFLLFFISVFLSNAVPQSIDKAPKLTAENGSLTIDFQTTETAQDQVKCAFNNSATVSYSREGRTFLRLDGLLGNPDEINAFIVELISHYHTDHVTYSVVEKCLREGNYSRLIAPYPFLASSRERVFSLIAEKAGITGDSVPGADNTETQDPVLDIAPDGIPEGRNPSIVIGDFYYSSFVVNNGIRVEVFKYQKPRNANTDGLIFRITHKNVSYLLFGDFDDPGGIENLLDVSAANEKRSIEIKDEVSDLTTRISDAFKGDEDTKNLVGKIIALNSELSGLVILKADIIKWPHHAHKFPDNERTNGILREMNEVVDPFYIIWQRYPTQNGFREYITRFDFSDKFLCSDDQDIFVISLFRIEHFFLFG